MPAAVARAAGLLAAVPPRREWVVMLPGDPELTVRPAACADAAALAGMYARCSEPTLRRYPAELAHPGLLPAVLEGAPGALALVAEEPGGALVALAGLHPLGARPSARSRCSWRTAGRGSGWRPRWCGVWRTRAVSRD
ncbi:MAG TPA: hypothetical protein VKP64_10130 [Mycobacteriales bacterium]|nr:hypothetical protein [Mycobacteriales bacterium]